MIAQLIKAPISGQSRAVAYISDSIPNLTIHLLPAHFTSTLSILSYSAQLLLCTGLYS